MLTLQCSALHVLICRNVHETMKIVILTDVMARTNSSRRSTQNLGEIISILPSLEGTPPPRLIIAQFENLMNTNLVIDFIYFVPSIRLSVFFRVLSIIQGFTGRRYSRYLSRTISGYGFDGKCTATVARRVPFSTSNLKTSIWELIARAFGTDC